MGPVDDWMAHWQEVEPLIDRALRYSPPGADKTDVVALLETGRAQLWRYNQTAAVTYVDGTVFWVWLAAGNQDDLKVLLSHGETWAKRQGCARIGMWGRPGWRKSLLSAAGFKTKYVWLERELWAE